jgi:hypothetical protein
MGVSLTEGLYSPQLVLSKTGIHKYRSGEVMSRWIRLGLPLQVNARIAHFHGISIQTARTHLKSGNDPHIVAIRWFLAYDNQPYRYLERANSNAPGQTPL